MAQADEVLATIEWIEREGSIASIGQISPAVARGLDRFVKAGKLAKYRGYFMSRSPFWGLGPRKTIYATPDFARSMGAL